MGILLMSVNQNFSFMPMACGVKELQDILGLSVRPNHIEGFDISNVSGTYAVASMVCSIDGMPNRNRYRRFRIKTVEGSDDPAMMAEAVRRRYGRLRKEGGTLPDLVLVDGGITQVRAARAVLSELDLSGLPVAGLAKQFEEIHWGPRGKKIYLSKDSSALQVLQRLRDEAHRFALTYHRQLRSKRIHESVLDDILGIGALRKQRLLAHFGSVLRLSRATVEQLAEAPGVGPHMAEQIHAAISNL